MENDFAKDMSKMQDQLERLTQALAHIAVISKDMRPPTDVESIQTFRDMQDAVTGIVERTQTLTDCLLFFAIGQ
jgi:hypothetical protein